jgi:hypothetical protein
VGFVQPVAALAALSLAGVTPAHPHAGRPFAVRVHTSARDVRVCLQPWVGRPHCEITASRRARFVAPHPGRWTVSAQAGGRQVSRRLRIRPHERRLVVLAVGDSLVANLAAGLRPILKRRGVKLRMDEEVGRGLTKPDLLGFHWLPHARQTAARWKPDIVVMFVGGNEGYPIGRVRCCGTEWVKRLARRQRGLMRAYGRRGQARVYWSTLPAPGPTQADHVPIWAAENRALALAVRHDAARVFDIDALLSPGFVFRRSMSWHGATEQIRQADGVHLTRAGGRIAADALVAQLRAERVGVR